MVVQKTGARAIEAAGLLIAADYRATFSPHYIWALEPCRALVAFVRARHCERGSYVVASSAYLVAVVAWARNSQNSRLCLSACVSGLR